MKVLVGFLALMSAFAVAAAPVCDVKPVPAFTDFKVIGDKDGQCVKAGFVVIEKKSKLAFPKCYPNKVYAEVALLDLQDAGECAK